MDKNQIKLIVTDMDGTLLNSEHELPEGFFQVFEALKEKGITFSAASGRQYFNLEKVLSAVKEDVVFLAENGSYVVNQGNEWLIQSLDRTTVRTLVGIARQIPGADIVLCGKKKAYIENTSDEFISHFSLYFERYEVVASLDEIPDDDILKFTICDMNGSERNSYPHFSAFREQFQVKVSGEIWLDISHKLANKGRAVSLLQNKLGITPEQTVVFGDYLNDLEMMGVAYYSYAMANAHPEVKKAARFITKSNDENGVLSILNEILKA